MEGITLGQISSALLFIVGFIGAVVLLAKYLGYILTKFVENVFKSN